MEILKQRYESSKKQYEQLQERLGKESVLLKDWKTSLSDLEKEIAKIEDGKNIKTADR